MHPHMHPKREYMCYVTAHVVWNLQLIKRVEIQYMHSSAIKLYIFALMCKFGLYLSVNTLEN